MNRARPQEVELLRKHPGKGCNTQLPHRGGPEDLSKDHLKDPLRDGNTGRDGNRVVQISTERERECFSYAKHERDGNGNFVEMTGRDPQYVEMYGTGSPESHRTGKGKIPVPP